ncbi:NAD(P)H-binding protein [Alicyclobacillus fastidiosus]|uniref:NAD(P)H-binding protein n=1 Tax=Alicyclobacillus fastidiosus TaxID=392011 RepID=A0ABY6ZAT8_9BACL|nr:NAD(P)H-binding protein [Alicyclobacillus fastidiosus]WAH40005.1 NAD(P)H-binding protein [Alicyclobacillus fastidiosus]GMA61297.1 nucleotide-diphosphate-sugar epimerase [Alicyclobacillus fastidiosus]
MILVTGATGNVGRHIVDNLCKGGHQVRVLTRNPAKVSFPAEVEVAIGDLTAPETLKEALDGVQSVYLVRVPGSEAFPQIAKAFSVERIVFLSSSAVELPVGNAIGRNHLNTEELIRASGIKWTFLRPGAFMSNAFQWAGSIRTEGIVRAPFGDVATTPVDPRDIADVAAEVLSSYGHEGKIYTLTGPKLLTTIEQVKILSNILGKDIRFEHMAEEIAKETMKRFAPSEVVEALFQILREPPTAVLNTVQDITGRRPRTFQQWATDNAGAFQQSRELS